MALLFVVRARVRVRTAAVDENTIQMHLDFPSRFGGMGGFAPVCGCGHVCHDEAVSWRACVRVCLCGGCVHVRQIVFALVCPVDDDAQELLAALAGLGAVRVVAHLLLGDVVQVFTDCLQIRICLRLVAVRAGVASVAYADGAFGEWQVRPADDVIQIRLLRPDPVEPVIPSRGG
jgi:hypothetical protein